ncbi:MAG TPA: c-type cytochrome [Burkholderiales bacterium]|nr:c-type cytochrome [Burkholderiales bacterium]
METKTIPVIERSKPSKLKRWLLALGVLIIAGALFTWYKFFREEPQPDWVTATPEMRFKYGSIGAEHDAGIPYWIFYVMPRVFADKLPGPGGWASLGAAWEQGQELPVGFTKKTIGFPRVANNCAVCHTVSYRTKPNETPTFVTAGPGHTDVEAYFRFLVDAAKDPRFNADNLMREIKLVTDLSFVDRLIYRFLLIPITKKRLLEREAQFKWIYRPDFPDWGRGRDDAMNLTKYFMIKLPMDDTFGPTDMPSIWNLKKYQPDKGHTLNWAGDSHDPYSVVIDSALGLLGAPPHDKQAFLGHIDWLLTYLKAKEPPKFPFPIDEAKAQQGKAVFDANCAACHASEKTGTRLPLSAVNTDRGRLDSWNKQAAIEANKVVRSMGIERKGLVEETLQGYNAVFLDGIWLRAPYLHNGSVPTMRDMLRPAAERPKVFWRGYDLYDAVDVGFVSQGAEAQQSGTKLDVTTKSGSNQGHEFGTTLPVAQKDMLLEYLKTL